jgi:hypothetical protein
VKFLLCFLFLGVGLAQSLTGTYTLNDTITGSSMTLKLIENADKTLTGNLVFGEAPVILSGQVTGEGMANAILHDEATGDTFTFSVFLKEPQITLTASETGDEIILTRESAEAPTLVQPAADQPALNEPGTTPSEDTLANDPKLEECLNLLEDDATTQDANVIEDCQSYVNSILGQPESDTALPGDAEELAYCQEFLADAEAVAADPDEASYCQDYIKNYSDSNQETATSEPVMPSLEDSSNQVEIAPFAGVFKSNVMALTLQGDGDYTGTLEFKGKSYPVTASAQGNTLSGTFDSDGSSFDFSATLQDTTLTLESGGQSYTMLKDLSSQ